MSRPAPVPLILECDGLVPLQETGEVLLVEVGKTETYKEEHLPGALHVEYEALVTTGEHAQGLLPERPALEALFSRLGLRESAHVVAYDVEGGGRASRLLWTLAWAGHRRFSLLNGGLWAWEADGRPLTAQEPEARATHYHIRDPDPSVLVDANYVLAHLYDPAVILLDTRSPAEFSGQVRLAKRGGHIPGAINLDWVLCMNPGDNLRLHPPAVLEALFLERGIQDRDSEIVVYCQTHHRSSLLFIVLRSLGFRRVRAYAGSWSEWGNRDDTPVE